MRDKNKSQVFELLDLLEDMHDNLRELETRRQRILVNGAMWGASLFIVISCIMLLTEFTHFTRNAFLIIFVIYFIATLIPAIYIAKVWLRLKSKIYTEQELLVKLFQMTTEYVQDLNRELGMIDRAMIEMRLSRIGFENRYNFKETLIIKHTNLFEHDLDEKLLNISYVRHLISVHGFTLEGIKNAFKHSFSLEEVYSKLRNQLTMEQSKDHSLDCFYENSNEIDQIRKLVSPH